METKTRGKMRIPRWNFEALYFNEYIYAIGGGERLPSAERYSVSKGKWFFLPEMPLKQTGISLVPCAEHTIYSLGVEEDWHRMSIAELLLYPKARWREIFLADNLLPKSLRDFGAVMH